MNARIDECANFSSFEERATQVTKETPQTTATISDNQILYEVTFPLTVTKADQEQILRRFTYTQAVPLGDMQKTADAILSNMAQYGESIDLTFLSQFPYNISTAPLNSTHLLFLIKDTTQNPLMFQFATMHEQQKPPYFDAPRQLTLKDGEAFFLDLQATDPNGGEEGKDLKFTDNVVQFDILDDGRILFIPEINQTFDAKVTVTDPTGLSYSRIITFSITK